MDAFINSLDPVAIVAVMFAVTLALVIGAAAALFHAARMPEPPQEDAGDTHAGLPSSDNPLRLERACDQVLRVGMHSRGRLRLHERLRWDFPTASYGARRLPRD